MPAKLKLGRYGANWYDVPRINDLVRISVHETLMFFGKDERLGEKGYYHCLGLGKVVAVEHGENLDLVVMTFGRKVYRRIVVYDNFARKQIYTLKKGQLAWFYGVTKIMSANEEHKTKRRFFIARGFQAWYVPKVMDIKHYDLDTVEELEKENETNMLNFLDEILKGDENNGE